MAIKKTRDSATLVVRSLRDVQDQRPAAAAISPAAIHHSGDLIRSPEERRRAKPMTPITNDDMQALDVCRDRDIDFIDRLYPLE
jgi:hypothetical protein